VVSVRERTSVQYVVNSIPFPTSPSVISAPHSTTASIDTKMFSFFPKIPLVRHAVVTFHFLSSQAHTHTTPAVKPFFSPTPFYQNLALERPFHFQHD
jgi:hypothetical protein